MKMAVKVRLQQKNTFHIISILFVLTLMSILLVGYVFVIKTWNISMKATEDEAKQLVVAVESVFSKSLLTTLDTNSSDIEKA
jgi:competence protein ComGC